ncbi:amidohydrolase [Falsarthrobacter nasiphocae]|uniref:Amidohydrolase n=1 Tax=Falsarthrobacter nasiphocae TaxID=189863 RepID=A0AAE4C619_9MICC|nr:amidohydrolase [Falsarthrobacter nasiphocae]MDR6891667.1 amidohydrolase [Falsarthrobacter nasiphocae]
MSPSSASPSVPEIKAACGGVSEAAHAFRRDIHSHPELSFQEFRTTDRIVARLEAAGLSPVRLKGTGVCVDIGSGPVAVALRGDIDALPVQEETGLEFASVTEGRAHACGHDIHTSVMMGAALALAAVDAKSPLPARVRIIFQPAEERIPGGAKQVVEQGLLDDVPAVLACHCDPRIDVGQVGTRIGAITSAADTIRITLSGRGGHTSRPQLTEDLVQALSFLAANVPSVLARRIDARSGVSVVWGQIAAGSAPNQIPSRGTLAGTMRCLDVEAWEAAGDLLDMVVRQLATPFSVDVELDHIRGVPPVINSERETLLIEEAARAQLGSQAVVLTPQSMGGEDFAWMTQKVSGAMFRLGTRTPGGETYDLHRGDYTPDERALDVGIEVMTAAALRAVAHSSAGA